MPTEQAPGDGGRPITLRAMTDADGPTVLVIYGEGIATGQATFEAKVPEWAKWDAGHRLDCRIVSETDGHVDGWAALSPVSARAVYAGVAEVSVYIGAAARGRGAGRALLAALIEASEAAGIWTLRAGIFPENTTSVALHRSHGFRVLGVEQHIGKMTHGPLAGRWRDVVRMERRSAVVGID